MLDWCSLAVKNWNELVLGEPHSQVLEHWKVPMVVKRKSSALRLRNAPKD